MECDCELKICARTPEVLPLSERYNLISTSGEDTAFTFMLTSNCAHNAAIRQCIDASAHGAIAT